MMTRTTNVFWKRMLDWVASTDRTALLGLVAANLIPLLLSLFFDWEIGNLILFYWWENLVIGLYAILRLAFSSGDVLAENPLFSNNNAPSMPHLSERKVQARIKWFMVPFFTFHYFFFCFVHGVMLLVLLTEGGPFGFVDQRAFPISLLKTFWNSIPPGGAFALFGLVISHGISFARNYLFNGQYLQASPVAEMFRPYRRIVLLHVCILMGGFVVMMLGSSTIFVVIFIMAKTVFDALIHSRQHSAGKQPMMTS